MKNLLGFVKNYCKTAAPIFMGCAATVLACKIISKKAKKQLEKVNNDYEEMDTVIETTKALDLPEYSEEDYKNDKKMRFWLVEPEVKYWLCEKFEGHFFGLHGHGAQFFGGFRDKRYDGYMAGGGITYGYNWILSPHWNLEAEIGLGYERLWYKESDRIPCIKCYERKHKNYVGPTKAAISLVYIF